MASAQGAALPLESGADYVGFGITHLQEQVRVDALPHLHLGAQGGRTVLPVVALDVWMYVTSVMNMAPGPVRDAMLAVAGDVAAASMASHREKEE